MKVKIVCVGKVKRDYFKEALKQYIKMIPFPVVMKEVSDEPTEKGMQAEGEKILKEISSNDYVVLLDILGTKYNSEGFSKKMDSIFSYQNNEITFIIGGSYGVSTDVKRRANELISFSDLTFPHQLMRVILLEQIYRAHSIKVSHPYHK